MALIQVDALSFAYPGADRRTLDQISLSIDEEEYVVLCGGSGCGKTTFLRQLKPELTPVGAREGQILYKGQPLEAVPSDVTAMRIGYVQQNPENQIVTDTVWHELAFGLENMALPTSVIRRRVCEMASFFDMEDWFRKSTSELSGGQKQMVNLASVMAMAPEVLILDEPTSMLDPLAARNLLQAVKRINRELGVAVILCEHRLEEVFQDADRVIVMDKGQICRSGSPRQVAAELEQELEDVRIQKALPAAVQIFGELNRRGIPVGDKEFPISIRDGRRTLKHSDLQGQITVTEKIRLAPKKAGFFGKADNSVLEGRELWFRYEEKGNDILRGLQVSLYESEILALLGGNGAGKSTLLKILAGVLKPLRGSVKKATDKKIAMLPQDPQALFLYDSLWEDLLDCAASPEDAQQMAEMLGLADRLASHPYDLSGGELQRAALGKLLLRKADILLLDEPTKGLDGSLKKELAVLLKKLAADGKGILMVTHDPEFAADCAHRCALLFDGTLVSEDEPHAFFRGNRFYTTAAAMIAGDRIEGAVTCEEVIAGCIDAWERDGRSHGW